MNFVLVRTHFQDASGNAVPGFIPKHINVAYRTIATPPTAINLSGSHERGDRPVRETCDPLMVMCKKLAFTTKRLSNFDLARGSVELDRHPKSRKLQHRSKEPAHIVL